MIKERSVRKMQCKCGAWKEGFVCERCGYSHRPVITRRADRQLNVPKGLEQRRQEALKAIHKIALSFEKEGNSRQRKAALKTIANLSRAVV